MRPRYTNAEDMARAVGVDPDTYRKALRRVKYPRKRGTDWEVEVDGPEYSGMRTVLAEILWPKAA